MTKEAITFDPSQLDGLRAASDRDELLLELLTGVFHWLDDVQLFLRRGQELKGYLALDDNGIDDLRVRERRLPLSLISVACRTATEGIPYLGPLPDTDPCTALIPTEYTGKYGVAILALKLGPKIIGILIGHPKAIIDRNLRDILSEWMSEASLGLAKIIAAKRTPSNEVLRNPSAAQERYPNEEDADNYNEEDYYTKPDPIDVGAASKKKRKSITLTGHPPVKNEDSENTRLQPNHTGPNTPKLKNDTENEESEEPEKSSNVILLTKKKISRPEPAAEVKEQATPQEENRRQHARQLLRVEVHFETPHGLFTGFMEDISEGGIFVTTYTRPPIGAEIPLRFSIPGSDEEFHSVAEVRWLREPCFRPDAPVLPGMGMQFVESSNRMLDAIRDFISGRS